jgi:hypothetical protein
MVLTSKYQRECRTFIQCCQSVAFTIPKIVSWGIKSRSGDISQSGLFKLVPVSKSGRTDLSFDEV